ncbi:hypothetical protein TeGR_g14829 [Tetraparma gracilis]|uniref:Uncharacterized protein n=1 Tax=Tetraparma gracilis TaxID=2962635 RepID=A0ABQ6M3G4_9STRA|nr:hypothetical protein TeGR_g14829 [Tetraparma gracilis]
MDFSAESTDNLEVLLGELVQGKEKAVYTQQKDSELYLLVSPEDQKKLEIDVRNETVRKKLQKGDAVSLK